MALSLVSQSLLNEVRFPIQVYFSCGSLQESQSLLNEVRFPIVPDYSDYVEVFDVAIPSK